MGQIRLTYGDFAHELSDAAVSIRRMAEMTDAGVPYAIREIWSISGRLEGDSVAAIAAKIRILEAAYGNPFSGSIKLEYVDGATVVNTAHVINVVNTVDGIHVTGAPSYPIGEGAEYANFRNYMITVEALVRTNQTTAHFVFWEESVDISGGGPREVLVETMNTAPVRQMVANQTVFAMQQSGRCVTLFSWSSPPFPYYPNAVILNKRIGRRTPRTAIIAGGKIESFFETTWSYTMAFPGEVPFPALVRPTGTT